MQWMWCTHSHDPNKSFCSVFFPFLSLAYFALHIIHEGLFAVLWMCCVHFASSSPAILLFFPLWFCRTLFFFIGERVLFRFCPLFRSLNERLYVCINFIPISSRKNRNCSVVIVFSSSSSPHFYLQWLDLVCEYVNSFTMLLHAFIFNKLIRFFVYTFKRISNVGHISYFVYLSGHCISTHIS